LCSARKRAKCIDKLISFCTYFAGVQQVWRQEAEGQVRFDEPASRLFLQDEECWLADHLDHLLLDRVSLVLSQDLRFQLIVEENVEPATSQKKLNLFVQRKIFVCV